MADGDNNTGNSYSQQDVNRSEQMTFQARSLTEELKDQLGIRSRLNETEKAQLTLARQLQASAAENTVEIGNQGNINRQLTKDRKLLLKIETEKLGLLKSTTTSEQNAAKRIFQNQTKIQKLQDKLRSASGTEAANINRQIQAREAQVAGILKSASADTQRLALAHGMEATVNTLIGQRQKEAEIQKDINTKMGVSGALVKGTGALMERLGMRSGIFNDAMTDSAEAMQEMAEESTRLVDIIDEHGNITKGTLKNYSKMEIMLKGFSILSKGFGKAMLDPFTIGMAILDAFLDVNKAQTDFIRLTGQSASSLNGVNSEASALTDLLATAAELTKQTGLNAAAIFSPDQIGQLSDAKNLLGISAEQAGKLGMIMKLTGKSADQLGESIYENVDAGISQKVVYDDILSATDDITASVGGNTKALSGAASAARKLGLDLTKVNSIADGLMDFESSIGAELEAQLLTGKNINLSKARELALNNDLEGVANELAKNGATAAEYAKMNRIQQESLAKALGVSREELGKMVLTKEAMANMSDDEIAAARGVTLEQSKQMDIQERIKTSVAKLAQAFAPVLEAVVPIVEALLSVVGPIAAGIGKVANAFAPFVNYLIKGYALLIGTQKVLALIAGLQTFITVSKGTELGLGLSILANLGFQNAAEMYKLTLMTTGNTFAAIRAGLEATILGSLIAQTGSLIKNIGKLAIDLAIRMGIAAASLTATAATTFGVGAAIAIAAAVAAYAGLKAMTANDMVSQPGYGSRTLMGPEGTIALNNKDTVIAGTDLFGGGEQTSTSSTIQGEGKTSLGVDMRKVEAKLDQLISVISAGGDVFLDGNKVGSALVLGSYKSS